MKIILGSICLLALSMAACKNGQLQDKSQDSSYTHEEKLEIARLAVQLDNGFEQVQEFKEGKAVFYKGDSVGFVGLNGQKTMVAGIKDLQQFSHGLAACMTQEDIPCYIDSTGSIIKTFPDYQAVYDFGEDGITTFFHKNGKFGLMNQDFKELIPAKYNQTSFWNKGILIAETGGKWGAVDRTDKVVIPFEYSSLGFMDDAGWIMASKSNGSGYIDQSGEILIPLKFYNLFPFEENMAKFLDQPSGNYGLMNRTGKIILAPKYSDIQGFKNGISVVSNYTYVKDGETIIKRGFIDTIGKEIIPLTFTMAYDFDKKGFALVQDSLGFAYIDKTGKKLSLKINAPIRLMSNFEHGFAKIDLVDGQQVYLDGYQRVLSKEDLIRLRGEFFK